MDVIVVGGGVVGLAVACELARDGHAVELLERERPGQRASWVAAGLLTPSTPWRYPRALVELAFASEELYPAFVAELRASTGVDPELENEGILYPIGFGVDEPQMDEWTAARRQLGYAVSTLDRAALEALVPGIGAAIRGAAWQPDAARVRPPRLLAALVRRARDLDVAVVSGCDVVALVGDGCAPDAARGAGAGAVFGAATRTAASAPQRVRGVRTRGGQVLEADAVVLAAGAWSAALAGTVGLELDVRPVRGQILLLRGEPGVLRPTVNNGQSYLVPRRDGRILVGSTMEDAGFEAVTTPEALARLRRDAGVLLPATRSMEIETSWAGLRPGTADRMPYLGPAPGLPGLVLATGHYRNGILLAPITARITADVLAGRRPPVELSPFAPRAVDPAAALVMA